ncbi:hypothetical protein EV421DRAFT_1854460 [Armillaria borealis]|uniref:Ig-like domain-containing protein n=1 Tax=Armillaria borealis TaxID=47425 RepID=A0AA39IVL6_9AGAR|nr:hypothetical protein EV421DRAFT_1854460 [Armillaria borealis]
MVMKSAMGLCRALVHPPIVLGLLADGYRLTVVCRAPSESEDLVTELPDSFDFTWISSDYGGVSATYGISPGRSLSWTRLRTLRLKKPLPPRLFLIGRQGRVASSRAFQQLK